MGTRRAVVKREVPYHNFAHLHSTREAWLRQYVMRAHSTEGYARRAQRILDIGSSSGYCSFHMARTNPGAEVVGVDVAEAVVHYARRRLGWSSWDGNEEGGVFDSGR